MVKYFINQERTRAYKIIDSTMHRAELHKRKLGEFVEIECRILVQKIGLKEINQIEGRYQKSEKQEYENVINQIVIESNNII